MSDESVGAKPMIDKVTGRQIREDSAYAMEATWLLWGTEDKEGVYSHSLAPKDSDPLKFLDSPSEVFKLGKFIGNGLDARRWMNKTLGFGPYNPMETEFKD